MLLTLVKSEPVAQQPIDEVIPVIEPIVQQERLSEMDLLYIHESFVRYLYSYEGRARASLRCVTATTLANNNNRKRSYDNTMCVYDKLTSKHNNEYDNHGCECSNKCDFYTPPHTDNVYVCITRGSLHHCTSWSCDYTIATHEHRVCTLTGIVYPLDTYVILPTHNDFVDYSRKDYAMPTTASVSRKLKRIKIKQTAASKSKSDLTQKKPSIPRHPKRVFKTLQPNNLSIASNSDSDSVEPVNSQVIVMKGKNKNNKNKNSLLLMSETETHKKRCKARDFIKELFNKKGVQYTKGQFTDLKESDADRLSFICLDVWRNVIKTSYYQNVKNVYHFKPHCAVVLYNSITGTYINGVAVIKQDVLVANNMMQSKDLCKVDKQVGKLYTRTSSQLNEMMREMYEELNDKID